MNKTNDCNNFIQNCCCFHRRKSVVFPKNDKKEKEKIIQQKDKNLEKEHLVNSNVFVTVPLD
tara:strand:- start:283 stop:468 length:186 start_codon:yes stop_codon:yes gene_type:complete